MPRQRVAKFGEAEACQRAPKLGHPEAPSK